MQGNIAAAVLKEHMGASALRISRRHCLWLQQNMHAELMDMVKQTAHFDRLSLSALIDFVYQRLHIYTRKKNLQVAYCKYDFCD